jgi:chromate transporter
MLYIGIAGYGGGPSIIAYLKRILVEQRRWVTEQDFLTGVSLSQVLPGANALSTVVYLGYRLGGGPGALVTAVSFLTPSMVFMIVLSALYFAFVSLQVVQALFAGLGAVVVGLLVNALVAMGKSAIKSVTAGVIALAVFLAMLILQLSIPLAIVLSAVLGWWLLRPAVADSPSQTAAAPSATGWLAWGLGFLGVALLLWLTRQTAVTQLCLALLRVGALTFGGGYAAVALFQQEAVTLHHWLTNRQFLDGLALGQITPGPVVITATFIGYRVLGIAGAVLATVAVFLPGGLAMYFLARQHEQMKHLRWLQGMVNGIVAGFIGVLLSVTVHLTQQSVTDWKTALLALASAATLLIAKRDPLWVILGGAVLSLVLFR